MKLKIIAVLLLFIMVSCKTNVSTELYSSDIVKIHNSSDLRTYVLSLITIDVSEDNKDKLTKILKSYFNEIEFLKKENDGLSTGLVYKAKIALNKSVKDKYTTDNGIINFFTNKEKDSYTLGINVKGDSFDSLSSEINNEFSSSITIDEMNIDVIFNNDSEGLLEIRPNHVYLNNVAYAFEKSLNLEKRDKATLKIPLFMKDYLKSSEQLNILSFKQK